MEIEEQFEQFLIDSDLVDLIELTRATNDALDVVNLSEPQHSAMLGWCLTPNEGHGQGDALIKDFLIAAYTAAQARPQEANRDFFRRWPPSRVMTTGFGSAFVARETSIVDHKRRKRRLDLFLVDTANQIVVTIEHKAGAGFGKGQLKSYRKALRAVENKFPRFSFLYVVLDRYLEDYDEKARAAIETEWTLLDYSWLEASARRAREQVARNNESARLLMSYCERLTEWEGDVEKRISRLAAALSSKHEAVVVELARTRGIAFKELDSKQLSGTAGSFFKFFNQNEALCVRLVESKGIAAVATALGDQLDADIGYEQLRTQLNIAPPGVADVTKASIWPVYVNVMRHAKASREAERSRFSVRIFLFRNEFMPPAVGEEVDELLKLQFPELNRISGAKKRRFAVVRGLDAEQAAAAALERLNALSTLLAPAFNSADYER